MDKTGAKTITRRTALIGATAAAGTLTLSGCGFLPWQNNGPVAGKLTGTEPEILRSAGGKLSIDLVAQHTIVDIDGNKVTAMTYNGTLPGPTWMAKPGDKITVNFTNKLGETTNLHTHGFHVSPEGNSDNVMLEIKDGESFTYEYQLAADHPSGTFWYHPHHHGHAADQVFAGLYGAIIIEDEGKIETTADRVLVISDIAVASDGTIAKAGMMDKMMGREGGQVLVNGHITPEFTSVTNGRERLHVVNACTSRYMVLHIDHADVQLIGMDSGQYGEPKTVKEILIAPGNRADILMTLRDLPATLKFDSVEHLDSGNAPIREQLLATFTPTGAEAGALAAIPAMPTPRDIRKSTVTTKRNFTLAMPAMGSMSGMGGMSGMNGMGGMDHDMGEMSMAGFTINGETFDMNKINTKVAFGTIEEWTITNTSTMNHPFHLHVWPMQLIRVGDQTIEDPQWQDVVNVPGKSTSVVRVAFENHKGTAVYHCHILDHEDAGMMGLIKAS